MKLDHEYLCMAVLVQEIVSADYAFVIHTTNPSSGDSSEIYAEVNKTSFFLFHCMRLTSHKWPTISFSGVLLGFFFLFNHIHIYCLSQ